MKRVQIVLDEDLLRRAKHHSERSGQSLSGLVRQALAHWLAKQEPDGSWMGSVKPGLPEADDRWEAVQATIAAGMSTERDS